MEIMGIRIPTVIHDNDARRCDGCREPIDGTPWRLNLLDIVSTERRRSGRTRRSSIPARSSSTRDPAHVHAWMRERGYLSCRRGQVREIMRPVPIPGVGGTLVGLCDGLHRDDHEFVPA